MNTWKEMPSNTLYWLGMVFFCLGIISSIILFGGWWYPIFSIPTLGLLGISLTFLSLSSITNFKKTDLLGTGSGCMSPWCTGSIVAFSSYALWRIMSTPDSYEASQNLWLLLAGLGGYLIASLYIRRDSTYWVVLSVIILLALAELSLLLWQYQSPSPIHPMYWLANWFNLPDGTSGKNQSYVSGTFFARGGLSAFLIFPLFFCLSASLWAKCHIAIKMLLLWVSIACLAGIALTLSRAAYLGTSMGLLFFFSLSLMLIARYSIVKKTIVLLILAITFLPLFLVTHALINENFTIALRVTELSSDSYREELWLKIIPSVLNKAPWIGLGANSFDIVSTKLGIAHLGRSIHAHNDWLQIFVEYGLIGLGLSLLAYLTHIISSVKNSYRLSSQVAYDSIIPQSNQLAATVASLASIVAMGTHSLFDYQLHLTAIATLFAICLGILASSIVPWNSPNQEYSQKTQNLVTPKYLWVTLTLSLGVISLNVSYKTYKPELLALQSENNLVTGNTIEAHKLALEGLESNPHNPRLLILAAESAGGYANDLADDNYRLQWYTTCTKYWVKALKLRPNFAYATREAALAMDWSNQKEKAYKLHKRALALNPNSARGYEYLAIHYWLNGEQEKAIRSLSLAKTLPGSKLTRLDLEKYKKPENTRH